MIITNLPATISLLEDIPVGIFIFEIQALYGFTWSTVLNPDFVYSLLTESTNFEIDSSKGNYFAFFAFFASFWKKVYSVTQQSRFPIVVGKISTLVTLDYETVTSHSIEVEVADSTGVTSATGTLTVDIQDVNEQHSITNLPASQEINAQTDCPTTTSPVSVFLMLFCMKCDDLARTTKSKPFESHTNIISVF